MANPKSWMTTAIFTEWFNNCFVPEVEAYMKEKSLDFKALLIVDNAASHPQLEHPNLQLVFLPPNTTSLIQPLDQGIIATFKKYYIKTTYKFILNKLENESLTVKDVWKQFPIFDCLIHVASDSAQIRPRTLNACWKKVWPACVTDNTTTQTLTLSDEIINLALEIGGDGFNTFSHDDIDELLVDDALNLTVDGVVGLEGDNDEEEKSTPLTRKLIQEGLQLCSKLENHFLINDPNSERAFKLQRELQNCMSGYRELYKKIKESSSQSLITDYMVRKGGELHRTRMKFVKIRGLYRKYLLQRQSLLMMKFTTPKHIHFLRSPHERRYASANVRKTSGSTTGSRFSQSPAGLPAMLLSPYLMTQNRVLVNAFFFIDGNREEGYCSLGPRSRNYVWHVMSSSLGPLKTRHVQVGEGRCTLNMSMLKRPPIGVVWKFRDRGDSPGVILVT
ncbi:tigger transposable element-derived protein 1 [Trichonephila clavipes]|nr:tigger transposable element-derived protein 1 [Trichonephila clavipes]